MNPNSNTDRRSVLKTIGGIGAAGAVGGGSLLAFTGGASATGGSNYGDVTVTSDDGSVEYVAIFGSSHVEWDGFENEATDFSIDIDAKLASQDTWTDLHETGMVALDSDWGDNEALSGPGTSGSIDSSIGLHSNGNHDPSTDWHVVGSDPDSYGLPSNSLDPATLEVGADGGSDNFVLAVRSTYTWYDADGNTEFTKTFKSTVDITVTNEERSASGSGSNSGAVAE